jgi:hypothetical protein
MLNKLLPPVQSLHNLFYAAKPFKHISIDNFLEPELAEGLLSAFPSFDKERAKNEMGAIGGKATREDIRTLGEAYKQIDHFFASHAFLEYLSALTGIPDLVFDPEYFGGGTHENLHGQELDVHVDFNYHKTTKLHRRLNVIIYLNKEWEESWGGNIEIHSDPRNPDRNTISQFAPLFNRCVIFETNEYSWHGFTKIQLPEHKKNLSRKSFTTYFYTHSRPAHEVAPPHATFYIQRPLPPTIRPEAILTQNQFIEVKGLLKKRDDWINFYQRQELSLNKQIEDITRALIEAQKALRLPLLGYGMQQETAKGYYPDGWISPEFSAHIAIERPVTNIKIEGIAPPFLSSQEIAFTIEGTTPTSNILQLGTNNTVNIPHVAQAGTTVKIAIASCGYYCPKEHQATTDDRNLVLRLIRVTLEHSA